MALKYKAVKGFPDILPPESGRWELVEKAARETFAVYGFREIRIPVMEYTELFTRSIGSDTDIVEKEMFSFPDKKGRSLSLRPEATAGVARAYIERNMGESGPVKLYYSGPMFRYERPQKGRYRQFWQIGAETIGPEGPDADAELIAMLDALFKKLGAKNLSLEINTLGCPDCRPAYREALISYLKGVEKDLCDDCRRRLAANPLRALDCKNESCMKAIEAAPGTRDYICENCKTHFSGLKKYLGTLEVEYSENDRIVRGLDYYTRTVFEYRDTLNPGAQNAVAAGGRYDGLIEELGGPKTPAAGFALGTERLIMQMPEKPAGKADDLILIAAMGEDAFERGIQLAKLLREKRIKVELADQKNNLKKQLKLADRMNARYVFILGEDELKKNIISVRDMKSSEQKTLSAEKLDNKDMSQTGTIEMLENLFSN